ncbi:hypothetical protein L6452_17316 [Arctium lappa]|uniref:Uncharacterized protein n=1 Tax=Arctium lappa TaxID=4217 RepID=A0ACB9C385_ARCLA|nr:hypothetical protein L6452_17316 [Arctium lappa]
MKPTKCRWLCRLKNALPIKHTMVVLSINSAGSFGVRETFSETSPSNGHFMAVNFSLPADGQIKREYIVVNTVIHEIGGVDEMVGGNDSDRSEDGDYDKKTLSHIASEGLVCVFMVYAELDPCS